MNGLGIKRIALFAQGMQGLVVQLFAIHLVPQTVDLPALEFAASDLRLQVLHEGLGDTPGGWGGCRQDRARRFGLSGRALQRRVRQGRYGQGRGFHGGNTE
ncbi:hypothetical protein D9M68_953200 [compost metagenome]